ncbi:MAG: molybdopterin dinucleotide binding domain-containing protein [Acidimicrobiales bacterium]
MLIGRRHVRSNNSWMHNVEVLVKGKARCTLQVHPADADDWGLVDGGRRR